MAISFFVVNAFRLLHISTTEAISGNDPEFIIQHGYFESLDDSATLQDAMAFTGYIPVFDNKAKVDFGPQAYWQKYSVSNKANTEKALTLFLDNGIIAQIDIHVTKQDKLIDQSFLGNGRITEKLESFALPNYEFSLAPKETITFYIRSQSKGSANLPLVLFNSSDFNNHKQFIFLLWGSLVGLIFIMSIFNLILYSGVRDSVYLYYIGYILSILVEMSMLHGFSVFIFPKEVVQFLLDYLTAIHYFIVFFALMFLFKFLKFDKDKGSVYKYGLCIASLCIPFALSAIWIPEYIAVQIYFAFQGLVYVYAFFLLAIKFKENFYWAKFYFISWLPIYIGGAITPAFFMGIMGYSFWIKNALLVSVMLEASLMALALANRLKSNEDTLLFSITHDNLTELANNSLMTKSLNKYIQNRSQNRKYYILVAEIQNFHNFSTYLSGQEVKSLMQEVAKTIEDHITALPLIYIDQQNTRGLEHCFILKDDSLGFAIKECDKETLDEVLNSIENKFPINIECKNISLSLRCRFGLSESTDGNYPIEVTSRATQAIIGNKQSNQILTKYKQDTANTEHRKIYLAADLQTALEKNELELYQQPQLHILDHSVFGSEALLRWNHPKLGFISPDEFVTIAEDTGIINSISEWVIDRAFEKQKALINLGHEFTMSINLSPLDIINNKICEHIILRAVDLEVPSSLITLEITETANISNQKQLHDNLQLLSKAGFSIAVDDFGTGYSSLGYLSSYPISELKIDKSFTLDLLTSQKHHSIVKATLSLAKSLDLKVVAEGVEDEDTLKQLAYLGCDLVQGFYFTEPLPFDEYKAWLKQQDA